MLLDRLLRSLLHAFPRPFRERHGRELLQTLLTDCRTPSGRLSMARLGLGAIALVRDGFAERLAARGRTRVRVGRTLFDAMTQDVKYGVRRLNQSRTFAGIAILTLALGIGVNTALFQLLDAVRLRRLPVASPAQLMEIRIENDDAKRGNTSIWHAGATNAIWQQIKARQQAFSGVFAWSSGGVRLSPKAGEPRSALALLVSGEFFDVLGVQPALGRLIAPGDDVRGCLTPAVVLSHAFWRTEYGADPSVVGRTLVLGRDSYRIAGVAAREFTGLEVGRGFDVAVPLCAEWLPPGSFSRLDSGVDWFLIVIGRRKPDWTSERAKAHLASISAAVFDASVPPNYPPESVASYRAFELTAFDASRGISLVRERYADALWLLQATAALVLIVGCANLANLMLARAATREREIAARLALGATRARILRVLAIESLLVSIAGAVAGAWVAGRLSAGLVAFLDGGANVLRVDLTGNGRFLLVAMLAGVGTCLLAGVAPAWRVAAQVSPASALRASGRDLTDSRRRVGLRQALVVAQVALSLVLVAGALLFTRSLGRLIWQDLGLRPEGLTIAYVDMSGAKVPVEGRAAFRRAMIDRLAATPGVTAAAETSVVPLSGAASDNDVWLDEAGSLRALSFFMDVGATYFDTLGTPVIDGRAFNHRRDTSGATRTVIVNEAFARRFNGGRSPVGKRLWREAQPNVPETAYEIVGLVRDAKYQNLRQAFMPTVYSAASQQPRPGTFAQLIIRTTLPKSEVVPALRSAFARVDPAIVPTFQDFPEMLRRSLVQDQLVAGLSAGFGLLSVLLATLGLYGTMSFAVTRRTREIGLRMALGADRRGILAMVLREASALLVIGCLAGAAVAWWLARFVGTLTYELAPQDLPSMTGAAALLTVFGLVACLVPARRAARLDPLVAFRAD